MLSCRRFRWFLILAMLAVVPATAPAADWTGNITCTLRYAGGGYSLNETQRWVIGPATVRNAQRTTYAVTFRDRGTLIEPIGTWTVGPATAPLTLTFSKASNGTTIVNQTTASGSQPGKIVWTGSVPRPHPTSFAAVEFDFLPIAIERGERTSVGTQAQGTTPPSYYQLRKLTPGRSTCSWNLVLR